MDVVVLEEVIGRREIGAVAHNIRAGIDKFRINDTATHRAAHKEADTRGQTGENAPIGHDIVTVRSHHGVVGGLVKEDIEKNDVRGLGHFDRRVALLAEQMHLRLVGEGLGRVVIEAAGLSVEIPFLFDVEKLDEVIEIQLVVGAPVPPGLVAIPLVVVIADDRITLGIDLGDAPGVIGPLVEERTVDPHIVLKRPLADVDGTLIEDQRDRTGTARLSAFVQIFLFLQGSPVVGETGEGLLFAVGIDDRLTGGAHRNDVLHLDAHCLQIGHEDLVPNVLTDPIVKGIVGRQGRKFAAADGIITVPFDLLVGIGPDKEGRVRRARLLGRENDVLVINAAAHPDHAAVGAALGKKLQRAGHAGNGTVHRTGIFVVAIGRNDDLKGHTGRVIFGTEVIEHRDLVGKFGSGLDEVGPERVGVIGVRLRGERFVGGGKVQRDEVALVRHAALGDPVLDLRRVDRQRVFSDEGHIARLQRLEIFARKGERTALTGDLPLTGGKRRIHLKYNLLVAVGGANHLGGVSVGRVGQGGSHLLCHLACRGGGDDHVFPDRCTVHRQLGIRFKILRDGRGHFVRGRLTR